MVRDSDAACPVPVRASPRLTATVSRKVPLPEPGPASATVIHGTSLVTVHAHRDAAFIATVMSCASPLTLRTGSSRRYVHGCGAGAACSTVTVTLAMVMVALRAPPELPAIDTVTEPLPDPEAPDRTSSQPAPVVARQAQPCGAVTAIDRCPPAASIVIPVGDAR